MLELGGFNEALYPNEENALMDELQKRGGKLIYDPQLVVHRRPRSNLKAFAKMLLTYGRGRAEQFRLHPTPGSALNFVPPLFCVYLLALPFLLPLTAIGNALAGAARALCRGRAGAGGGARRRRAGAPKPRGDSPDCADAYSVWPWASGADCSRRCGVLESARRARSSWKRSPGDRVSLGMKTPAWTNAIKTCADPQRARQFLDLLAATSAGAALPAASGEQARILAALFSGSQALSNLARGAA